MSMASGISALATRIATEIKSVRTDVTNLKRFNGVYVAPSTAVLPGDIPSWVPDGTLIVQEH